MFKKAFSLVLAIAMILSVVAVFASCSEENGGDTTKTLKVGVITIGDESEGYTKSHIDGITAAVEALKAEGINVQVSYKKNTPEGSAVETNALDLIASGCTLIIANSYGHQFHFGDTVKKNPNVTFVMMTGDEAAKTAETNDYNAFTKIYEARYVAGVAAGLKLQELVESGELTAEKHPEAFDAEGNIKIGYVGAFNFAEVVSGYTAFFLGVKSVVSNVSMTVKYTNSWSDSEREAAAAEYLVELGCVMIGQHADTTGAPAAVEKKATADGKLCYCVGYNISMLEVAATTALVSPTNVWSAYYAPLFKAVANGTAVTSEWAEGYAAGAVTTTALGSACAEGTKEALEAVVAKIKSGEVKVFDCSKFTVDGENLTTYTKANGMEGKECLVTKDGVTYFDESALRAAPYFDVRIDGITEVAYESADAE